MTTTSNAHQDTNENTIDPKTGLVWCPDCKKYTALRTGPKCFACDCGLTGCSLTGFRSVDVDFRNSGFRADESVYKPLTGMDDLLDVIRV